MNTINSRRKGFDFGIFMRYLILILVGIIMIYPMVWMVGASFRSNNAEIFS